MGDTDQEVNVDMLRMIQSSLETSSFSSSNLMKKPSLINQIHIPQLNTSSIGTPMRHFTQNFGGENNGKRAGIPPISPYSQIPVSPNLTQQLGSQVFSQGGCHSRSLSQPSFVSLDLLPPLSPSPYRDSPSALIPDQVMPDVSMNLPPRKAHRRSSSDIPFGFSTVMQSSPPLLPLRSPGALPRPKLGRDGPAVSNNPVLSVKRETNGDNIIEGTRGRKSEGEVVDDIFSAYMNLENIDTLNSSGTDEKRVNDNREDLDSRVSGTKTNDSSDNEAESSVNESDNSMTMNVPARKREGVKRSAGGDIDPTSRHYRSVSMDSFKGKIHFGEELQKFPASPGPRPGQLSPSNSMDRTFSLEFGNGEFSADELKKIMANDKLAEIALSDPKRVKRILANRQSAARSKERKMRYISELEHKVQTLQTEATTLSAQLTHLQRDSVGLTSQNNELKFRLQAMEQQAQLRDALNEALTAEVQRLKLMATEHGGQSHVSKSRVSQISMNAQMFQMSQQQSAQLKLHQLQLQEPQQQQQNGTATTHESNQ